MVRIALAAVISTMLMGCAFDGTEDVSVETEQNLETKDVLAVGHLSDNGRGFHAGVSGGEDTDGRCGGPRKIKLARLPAHLEQAVQRADIAPR